MSECARAVTKGWLRRWFGKGEGDGVRGCGGDDGGNGEDG